MNFDLKKEIPLFLLLVTPFIYLAFIWSELPAEVPIHYNINGEADQFSSNSAFAVILAMVSVFTYSILQALPFIDPKNKVKEMGNKYYQVKFLTLGLISVLAFFLIYKTVNMETPIQFLTVILGLFFVGIGNYFQTIKPNYFLGVKTPWTLENENVWKKTHIATGKAYMIGGFLMALSYFVFPLKVSTYFMLFIIIPIGIFPFVYSFLVFKKLKQA